MGSDARVGETQQQKLAELRRKMAAIPGRGESAVERAPHAAELRREALPVPAALAELLPDGGLVKGSVVAYAGARSLLAGLLAAVTEDGGHAAVVGLPRFGLLAAAEMGADLARLAVVAEPGPDPIEVASVLLDGLDLVVLGLDGGSVAPARARVLAARARNKGATLVVTDGAWPNPALRIDARIAGYVGLGTGHGRLHSLTLEVAVRGKTGTPRHGHLDLRPTAGRVQWFPQQTDAHHTELPLRARGAAS
ncbi:hypothetical protein [Nocardia goodfellowii]|uniref:Recombinase A n=1 Tax=Nocardia goodfellowii TaxID=882446 RepID=A0ABS4Q6I6_9NOCA|nr:hypothetical protein [Nocardia goodfellowii]MBP2187296.1 hypothetical protein [Nocardia goodfellowii]